MKGRITLIFFISCFLLFPAITYAQEFQVSGKVTSKSDGSPLPGVTVAIEGSKTGTSTNGNGEFVINVPKAGTVLSFSQLGMETQTFKVQRPGPVNISLNESNSTLNEVVVVGYGTQKKSEVTGAISSVKAKDLENQQITRVEQALQGRTSGVTIASNSGAPGSASTVRVRGITSLNSNNPLYVIDGVVVDNGGIDYLNSADIENIEVLKDAASAAIYGARASAGVILVTTKKGKSGGLKINYNGYYGTQAPARKLDLLDATQYATLRNEASVSGGAGIVYNSPASLGAGTDWQDALFNKQAIIQDQQVNVSGGNEKSTFYTSFGYIGQEGIVATDISNYKRYNIRLNSTHKIKSWLQVATNLGYSHIKSKGGLSTNSEFGGPLSSAINLDPTTPTIETDPAINATGRYALPNVVRDANGNPYGISNTVQQEMTNPLAYVQTRLGNYGWSDNLVGNLSLDLEPIKGLKFTSTLGSKLAFWGGSGFTPLYYLNATQLSNQTSFGRDKNQGFNWSIENNASYSKTIAKHNFTVLVGMGAYEDNNTSGNSINFNNIAASTFDEATFNLKVPVAQISADAYDGITHTVSSIYSRLLYNYNEKYLFTGIIRRDGSSRFGSNNKYGYFPSASVGWVPTNENFWPKNKVVNTLKIRGSYGVNGNDELGNFRYVSTVGSGRNYVFGLDNLIIGYSPDAPANPDLKWEETTQLNIGFDAALFDNWNLTFDWYNKKTKGILRTVPLPSYGGFTGSPWGNVADMANKGVELELGYRKQIGKLNFNIKANSSFLDNKVTYLGTTNFTTNGAGGIQNVAYELQRTQVGHTYNSFYGFKTAGIFQNQAEVSSYVGPKGNPIQPLAQPGDFRWVDSNNDGAITEADRQFLGSPIPNFNYGFTFKATYQAFDLNVFGQGVSGNKIFQGLRRLDIPTANWTTNALGRWTGEGSSNTYPRISSSDPNKNFSNPSDFYLEDGAYFRIKTLQIGYSLPRSIASKAKFQNVRFYVSSNNLITFTKYTGFDPEIGGGSDTWGIDAGIYPQARSFIFGVNIGL
ncbi:MAG: TonB-dependent receptor [Sphingobacteriales bacterium]|nr:TonB-dependent receptor [Sphingobacteriales bacterium]